MAAGGSGRSTSVIPAVPAALSVTTIAFIRNLPTNDSRSGADSDGGPVITFQPSGDIDEAKRELESRGVEFAAEISEHPWGRIATFKDSEGNDLQLYAPPRD